jgi:hypothetical protein
MKSQFGIHVLKLQFSHPGSFRGDRDDTESARDVTENVIQ